jgi:hypothetical protein
MCGYTLVTICIPADFSFGTESGAGASIQSTVPASSAATRDDASGIARRISRSDFGTRAGSQ